MQLRRTRSTIVRLLSIVAAALLLAMAAGGCGGGGSSDASAKGSAGPAIPDSPPKITIPESLPPKKLVIKDLRKGTGKEAQKGDKIMIQYFGLSWENGEHANSWRYSHIPTFVLGDHRLLYGLDIGIRGMKEGGNREIIIPNNLIYYPGVSHATLGRLSALIYRVYLVKVLDKEQQG